MTREELGRLVRHVWVEWAREQDHPKLSWLVPWEDLDDGQREVDMRIGEALFHANREAPAPLPPGELQGLQSLCAALYGATETDPLVKDVAWRTFALIRVYREQSAELDRLRVMQGDAR